MNINININNLALIPKANQDFSKIAKMVDEDGAAVIDFLGISKMKMLTKQLHLQKEPAPVTVVNQSAKQIGTSSSKKTFCISMIISVLLLM
ncbi:hypothetical protein [Tissierella sp.]|uniref:hypothetical protein n=1 Tax=Tissierella sp. TaxID=41274 RepID=UPI0028AB509F|nr:hypothetical protein [Tissierella sp.]